MPSESISTANYLAVIEDLCAKRAELDRTIAMLRALAGIVDTSASATVAAPRDSVPKPDTVVVVAPVVQPKTIHNASGNTGIGDACARILRDHDAAGPLSTRQVLDLLVRSGFELNATNPINNVWSALDNRTKAKKDIRKIGRNWRYVGSEKPISTETVAAIPNGLAPHTHS